MECRGLCHCSNDEYLQMFCLISYSLFKWAHIVNCCSTDSQMASQYHHSHFTHPQIIILQKSLLIAGTFPITLLETSHKPSLAHLDSLPSLGDEENLTFLVLKLSFNFREICDNLSVKHCPQGCRHCTKTCAKFVITMN